MSGLRLISHDDVQLREQLSLEIIRRRDFANLGSDDGFNVSLVPVSGVPRRFGSLRWATSDPMDVSAETAFVGNIVPVTQQFLVTTVDEQGHVHTSPLVTTSIHQGLSNRQYPTSPTAPLNHAFLCMDLGSHVIEPQMVSFSNNVGYLHNGINEESVDLGVGQQAFYSTNTSFGVTPRLSTTPHRRSNNGTPPHDVIETVAATIVSTIPNQKASATTGGSKRASSKRSLNTDLSVEAKKKKAD